MKKKLIILPLLLLSFSLPLMSIVNGRSLSNTLKDLNAELKDDFHMREEGQIQFNEDYDRQHRKMIDIIKESSELSLLLYTQNQGMTFDMLYALKKVTSDYNDFNKDRRPYDHIISDLNYEIDRYARLIEALRRLPPMLKEVEVGILPDSLLYRNDSLDIHISQSASSLEREVILVASNDTSLPPFVLDRMGEIYRDSCILYASQLLKINAEHRDMVVADRIHYQEAYLRMKEAYDYAEERYVEMGKYVFAEGQTSMLELMSNPGYYWRKTMNDLREQYNFEELPSLAEPGDTASAGDEDDDSYYANLSRKGLNALLVLAGVFQLIALFLVWIVLFIILWLVGRFAKPKRFPDKKQLPAFSILVGTFLYFLLFGFFWGGGEYVQMGVRHVNTFLWLLMAIFGSLLLRVKPEQLRSSIHLYTPTIIIAIVIILCRIVFIPDRFINLLFPPLLLLIVLRQLAFSIREHGKATAIDSALGWASLAIYLTCFVFSFFGYPFVSLLILVWWYFQLAVLLTVFSISDLLRIYKERWLDKHVDAMRRSINYVSGEDRESLLFGATWFYDLIRQVGIPVIVILSLPMCIHLSLNVFDFNDLYVKTYHYPFVHVVDKDGFETLYITCESIVRLSILFFIVRYLNRAVHAVWQYTRYAAFMRRTNRKAIRANEINMSLGNSIISVLIWMAYIIVVVTVWQIPVGSLSLVAGGLSAGIGLAMKDILNNFIYGIQLMGGRVRVGDWIECEGVRGKVTAINYQCVQMETIDGTEMSFLNASLFGKNFINLTRNNSYEKTTISVGVAYGTDVQRVREVLVDAMQQMRTKDQYGREIVDPSHGIYVVVENMSDSSVDVAVKQYVLVAERIPYVDRAKEVVYNALQEAGITIPFPQCDVHLVKEED